MTRRRAAATRAKLNNVTRCPGDDSPCEEHGLSINSVYLASPEVTIIHRVDEPGFLEPRVSRGDLVVADRRVRPGHGSLVIALIKGKRSVRLLTARGGREFLWCDGDRLSDDLEITNDARIEVLASVVSVIPVTQD